MSRLVEPRPKRHRYTSTACFHGLHGRCRQQCKFCDELCRCKCHRLKRKLARMMEAHESGPDATG